MAGAKLKSGIQKEVFALYRTLLREATKKDRASASASASTTTTTTLPFSGLLLDPGSSTAHVRDEFRKQALQVHRKDFRTIEYKIRHGYKQLKLLQMPGVVTFRSW